MNRIAIADGRVAVAPEDDDERVELLASLLRSLERHGYDVVVFVDDDVQVKFERSESDVLEEAGLQRIPPGVDAAQVLLEIADGAGATVVSNDSFEEYQDTYPWITRRRMPYRVFQGEIYLDPEDLMGVF